MRCRHEPRHIGDDLCPDYAEHVIRVAVSACESMMRSGLRRGSWVDYRVARDALPVLQGHAQPSAERAGMKLGANRDAADAGRGPRDG